MIKLFRSAVLTLLLPGSFSFINAQTTTTGGVAGVITDPSGAAVSGASVTLRNVATDAVQQAKSSNSGSYRFDLLPPGVYKIDVKQIGFGELESDVTVDSSKVWQRT